MSSEIVEDLPNLVFLHIAKSGGRTFRQSILTRFYTINCKMFIDRLDRNVFWDYDKNVTGFNYPENVETFGLITGHFKATKYLFLNRPMITLMRNPVDRTISNYYWWKSRPEVAGTKIKKMFEEGIDIIEFSQLFENYMSYIIDIDLNKFKFIGILEQFELGVRKFEKIFDVNIAYDNKIKNKGNYEEVTKDIRDKILKYQEGDMDLYNRALEIFEGYQ